MPFLHLALLSIFLFACKSEKFIDYSTYPHTTILEHYSRSMEGIETFRANATITLTYEENGKLKSDDIRAEILLNKNDSLHIQLNYSIMNIDVSTIFIGKDHFVFKTRTDEDDVFIRGFTGDRYLNRFFSIDIPLKDWGRSLFLAALELPTKTRESKLLPSSELEFVFEGVKFTLRNDALLPKRAEFYSADNALLSSINSYGLLTVGSFEFPKKVVYYNKVRKSEMTIEYSSIEVNKKLAVSDFTVKIPPNIRQVRYE